MNIIISSDKYNKEYEMYMQWSNLIAHTEWLKSQTNNPKRIEDLELSIRTFERMRDEGEPFPDQSTESTCTKTDFFEQNNHLLKMYFTDVSLSYD